ncbi:phosphate-binding protein [Anoxybacter fermentans]|uniref:Phosphate-binding protein n=1 Tax=Anoxybacter fermentans TaxID=1323375 RepID=A0A3Q9HSU3_9FIRM|nr:phosphate ABC transporter substrate-binding protein [Anoxybacter fermentans]AZR74466.1 phosphate-binding protein [Anoxybacter fermentans]
MRSKKVLGLIVLVVLIFGGIFVLKGIMSGGDKNKEEMLSGQLQIKGSDTIVNLAQILAEHYMKKRPEVAVAVTGGGSGVGIAALINGKIDIANASRAIKDKEIKQAKERDIEPVPFVIGMDGVSFIVNENNPVKELSLEQLGAIYRGEITNWKDVGGKDQKIVLYGRQSNSGTYAFVQEFVLNGDYSQNMMRMNGNAQIVEAVKADEAGIGYVGVGYIKDENGNKIPGLNILSVKKDENSPAYNPLDTEAVKAGNYPIVRPLYEYTNGTPQGIVRDWIEFVLSEEGQKIVESEGFFGVPVNYAVQNEKNLK